MLALHTLVGFALLGAYLGGARLFRAPPRRVALAERLAALPKSDLPLREPVRVHWNEHHVPFIEANHDRDVAVALGVTHAHLRLAQMEFMRRIAYGRLAEILGPTAVDIDHVLRILGVGRAVPQIAEALPEETRSWLGGFVEGINHAIDRGGEQPHEFSLLGFKPTPWTAEDVLAIGRLAGADFTWRVWVRLLKLRGRADWLKLWQRLMRDDSVAVPSFAGSGTAGLAPADPLSGIIGRGGSNSIAVARKRSATGSALIASDPHLSIVLPNLWLVAGYKSPGYHVVGLMIPGVPAMALGRNPWIAWGGTNLHAASSDLFDVTGLPEDEIGQRRETIKVRWSRNRIVTIRETEFGPIITDAPLLDSQPAERLALQWVGHCVTDELTALLRINRARTWREFTAALDGYAIPAQNMIYADAEGNVGKAMAAKLPRRPPGVPVDLVAAVGAKRYWKSFVTATDLPRDLNPPQGFVASANDRPAASEVPVGYFFSPTDRIRRLSELLAGPHKITAQALQGLQRDVLVPSAIELRDLLHGLIVDEDATGHEDQRRRALFQVLNDWDGRYEAGSVGALAFELLVYNFVRELSRKEDLAIYTATWDPWTLLRQDLASGAPERLARAADRAARRSARGLRRFSNWGDIHRLRLSHFLASVPSLGKRYHFAEVAAAGSNETLMKTAHGFSGSRHTVRYGANARHISDLSDPDHNYFVLLGGQDGWLGSTTLVDQFELWQRGDYVQVPIRVETVRARFPYRTDLMPTGIRA